MFTYYKVCIYLLLLLQVLADIAGMESAEVADQLMYDIVAVGTQVFDACEAAFSDRNMLNLP